jgi:cytoskeletal protein CcmA (bactofilin family)
LSGDIIISYDLELDGEVEGNISSEHKSNIIIKGTCSGNISTREGNVDIEGKMRKGDIIAGGNIKITGSFNGGRVESKGTIYVNGEFSGRLEGKDIEIGPAAKGKGELFYKDNISIAKGAGVEVNINRYKEKKLDIQKAPESKVVAMESMVQGKKELKKQSTEKQ